MAIGNVALMQECFPKHLCMGTAKIKYDQETEGKQRGASIEALKAGKK